MTYKASGRSIINYAAPVWSTNLRDTNYRNMQYTQNEALKIATGCHKMSSVGRMSVFGLRWFWGSRSASWSREGRVVLCMCVCCESGFLVEMAGPGICVLCSTDTFAY